MVHHRRFQLSLWLQIWKTFLCHTDGTISGCAKFEFPAVNSLTCYFSRNYWQKSIRLKILHRTPLNILFFFSRSGLTETQVTCIRLDSAARFTANYPYTYLTNYCHLHFFDSYFQINIQTAALRLSKRKQITTGITLLSLMVQHCYTFTSVTTVPGTLLFFSLLSTNQSHGTPHDTTSMKQRFELILF